MVILWNLLGIAVILGICYATSRNRKQINWRLIGRALALQTIVAFILVKFSWGRQGIALVSSWVDTVLSYGQAGMSFSLGNLSKTTGSWGYVFGIHALFNIIFVGALVSALSYVGVLGYVIKKLGALLSKILGASRLESFVDVANMFLGQTEAPLLIKRYIGFMTESELMVVLISGMGSMSASILGGYTAAGVPMRALLIASALVPFGCITLSKLLIPETEIADSKTALEVDGKAGNENIIAAASSGAMDGMQIVISIIATTTAFVALMALLDGCLGIVGLSCKQLLSYLFAPLGYFLGFSGEWAFKVGSLLGTKLALNEFVAFGLLGKMSPELLAQFGENARTVIVVSLAGFANVGSMGVCLSGLGAMCPEKKGVLAKIVLPAMLGAFAVNLMNAMIVSIMYHI